jgi:hypothetical protein
MNESIINDYDVLDNNDKHWGNSILYEILKSNDYIIFDYQQ